MSSTYHLICTSAATAQLIFRSLSTISNVRDVLCFDRYFGRIDLAVLDPADNALRTSVCLRKPLHNNHHHRKPCVAPRTTNYSQCAGGRSVGSSLCLLLSSRFRTSLPILIQPGSLSQRVDGLLPWTKSL